MTLFRNKRLWTSLSLLALLAGIFWSGSRYPALNEKAAMGAETEVSGLAFDIIWELPEDPTLAQQVSRTAVNWGYTNWKGMVFGLLFASAIMCALSCINPQECTDPFGGALWGTIMGAPLGVCVNCATPIGQGIYAAGARPAASLAATISSPTLNVLVLSMLFTLLPWYLAVIKIIGTLLVLFVFLPFSLRILKIERRRTIPGREIQSEGTNCVTVPPPISSSWRDSLRWLAKVFPQNLCLILRKTVPAMIAAGLLGAAIVSIIPVDEVVALMPEEGRFGRLLGILLIGFFGLLLPVPIAFDVILITLLLGQGMEAGPAMALLFSLGIFSIYPWWVIGRSMSFTLSSTLAGAMLLVSLLAGVGAHYGAGYAEQREQELFVRTFLHESTDDSAIWPQRGKPPGPATDLETLNLDIGAIPPQTNLTPGVSISKFSFVNADNSGSPTLFTQLSVKESGLDEPTVASPHRLREPFAQFRPIAAGDIHNDGWDDIVMGSDPSYGGFSVFANQHGTGFVRQECDIGEMANHFVVDLTLVDMNNDGWLDLVLSSFGNGVRILFNSEGQFSHSNAIDLDIPDNTVIVSALAFGDIDRDGDLDAALGRWSVGGEFHTEGANTVSASASRNLLIWNEDQTFRTEFLPATPGETLSLLLSDFTQDGRLDLSVGNDFGVPDMFYLGGNDGRLRLVNRADGLIERVPRTTMSITSSDIDNDLRPDLFIAQFTEEDRNKEQRVSTHWVNTEAKPQTQEHHRYARLLANARNQRSLAPLGQIEDSVHRRILMGINILDRYILGTWRRSDKDAEKWLQKYVGSLPPDLGLLGNNMLAGRHEESAERMAAALPEQHRDNALLMPTEKGRFVDRATELGVNRSNWAWNSKFADVDNDGLQDLFVVNGYLIGIARASNHWFHNRAGEGFSNETESAGLVDRVCTSAYVYLDYDRDGDLDIVTVPIDDMPRLYKNTVSTSNAITFRIRDYLGNRFGVGCRLTIRYGTNGQLRQMREIKASGGFISHDPLEAQFGLGKHTEIKKLEILWSTGEKSDLETSFEAGSSYVITRR